MGDMIIRGGIDSQPFDRIRIITEPDWSNPCVQYIQQVYLSMNVVVQSKSVGEDALAIINAHYFVPAPSLFSKVLALMNDKLQVVWIPEGIENLYADLRPNGFLPCGGIGEPKQIIIRVPGVHPRPNVHPAPANLWKRLASDEPGSQGLADYSGSRREWMLNYDVAQISIVRICDSHGPACRDQNVQCGHWAKNGECKRNPRYMLQTCMISCGVCNRKHNEL